MKRWLPPLNSTGGPATAPRRALSDGYADHQGAIRTAVREVGQLVSSADGSGTSLALIPRPVLSLRAARHDRIIVWLGFQSKPRFPAPFLPLQASVFPGTPSYSKPRFPVLFLPLQASLSGTLPPTPSLAFRHPSSRSWCSCLRFPGFF